MIDSEYTVVLTESLSACEGQFFPFVVHDWALVGYDPCTSERVDAGIGELQVDPLIGELEVVEVDPGIGELEVAGSVDVDGDCSADAVVWFDWSVVSGDFADLRWGTFRSDVWDYSAPPNVDYTGARRELRLDLNACGSEANKEGRWQQFHWTVRAKDFDFTVESSDYYCNFRPYSPDPDPVGGNDLVLPREGSYDVTLTAESSNGTQVRFVREIRPEELIIVAFGDSYLAGEGNPTRAGSIDGNRYTLLQAVDNMVATPWAEIPEFVARCLFDEDCGKLPQPAPWLDRACHRSAKSGAFVAAARLDDDSPYQAVNFLNLACSGAELSQMYEYETYANTIEGPKGGSNPWLAPQWAQAVGRLCAQECPDAIDAILLSGGVNDVDFRAIVTACATPDEALLYEATPGVKTIAAAIDFVLDNWAGVDLKSACNPFAADTERIESYWGVRTTLNPDASGQVTGVGRIATLLHDLGNLDFTDVDNDAACDNDPFVCGLARDYRDRLRELLQDTTAAENFKQSDMAFPEGSSVFVVEYPAVLFGVRQNSPDTFRNCSPPFVLVSEQKAANVDQFGHSVNLSLRKAAQTNGWRYVDGISERYADGGHGMCNDAPYYVSLFESMRRQGHIHGTAHPDEQGHAIVADQIAAYLLPHFRRGFFESCREVGEYACGPLNYFDPLRIAGDVDSRTYFYETCDEAPLLCDPVRETHILPTDITVIQWGTTTDTTDSDGATTTAPPDP